MASIIDLLCDDQHALPVALTEQPAAADTLAKHAEQAKCGLGRPPLQLNGTRRKSGWGKRFKEREQGRLAIIFPRRKMGEAMRGSDAVWLSVDVLNSLSDRSLASAAKLLVRLGPHPTD
jgi:hypothetical protein